MILRVGRLTISARLIRNFLYKEFVYMEGHKTRASIIYLPYHKKDCPIRIWSQILCGTMEARVGDLRGVT